MELGRPARGKALQALRAALPGKAVGSISLRPDAAVLRRSARLGFDFHLGSWRSGDPPPPQVLAHLKAFRSREAAASRRLEVGRHLKKTTQRLAILTDIVKTANSILEPRKVIELIMAKIQQLIPSEAWSMLMVDEEKQELAFELALGEKGKDVSSFRVKIGEGIAGWVAQTGKPAIVNDTSKDPRFAGKFDTKTQFRTRSILAAPLISRGRTIGVVEIINKLEGKFTQADLEILLTLVEPCAIAIENAILFQRTEQLTITDDLTKLFNSRYLNLYIGPGDQALQAPRHPALDHLPRPGRLQGHQRRLRPPGGVEHPHRGGGILAEAVRGVGHPGPLRWRRVRGGAAGDAGLGGAGHRGAHPALHRAARVPGRPGAGRAHLRVRRHRLLSRPRAHPRGPHPEGGPGHVPGQGARQERHRGGGLIIAVRAAAHPRRCRTMES